MEWALVSSLQSYDALCQDLARLLENERSAKRQGLEQEKAQTYWKGGQRLERAPA